jgi:hypothetical protein
VAYRDGEWWKRSRYGYITIQLGATLTLVEIHTTSHHLNAEDQTLQRDKRERERERQRERQEKGEMTVTRMNSTTAKNTPAAMSLIRFRYMEFFRFLAYQERELSQLAGEEAPTVF